MHRTVYERQFNDSISFSRFTQNKIKKQSHVSSSPLSNVPSSPAEGHHIWLPTACRDELKAASRQLPVRERRSRPAGLAALQQLVRQSSAAHGQEPRPGVFSAPGVFREVCDADRLRPALLARRCGFARGEMLLRKEEVARPWCGLAPGPEKQLRHWITCERAEQMFEKGRTRMAERKKDIDTLL